MTKRDFALILVRLMGLYVLAMAFPELAWLNLTGMGSLKSLPSAGFVLSLGPFVLQACFGIFLWLFASALAGAMIDGMSETEPISRWQPREVICIGLVIIGILSLLRAVAGLGLCVWRAAEYVGLGMAMRRQEDFVDVIYRLFLSVPSILVGFSLIFGARFLSFWIAPRGEFVPRQLDETAPDAAD